MTNTLRQCGLVWFCLASSLRSGLVWPCICAAWCGVNSSGLVRSTMLFFWPLGVCNAWWIPCGARRGSEYLFAWRVHVEGAMVCVVWNVAYVARGVWCALAGL